MEPTNPNQDSDEVRNSESVQEENKELPKATLGELYQFLTGKYYTLLIVGSIAAFVGGKYKNSLLFVFTCYNFTITQS